MTHIDTSAEACELWAQHMTEFHDKATADLIRQLVRERDEARERALDEAVAVANTTRVAGASTPRQSANIIASAILALKGPKP